MACKTCGQTNNEPKLESVSNTKVVPWSALPEIDIDNVPDDLDLICGSNSEFRSWRIPATYFLGTSSGSNVKHKITTAGIYYVNETTSTRELIAIGSGQVMPIFREVDGGTFITRAAMATTNMTATDIAVYEDDSSVTIMNSGYYTFSRPHQYSVGRQYYLSQTEQGQVVSQKPTAGIIQPLFVPVDSYTISINFGVNPNGYSC